VLPESGGLYSPLAEQQLDELQAGADADLYTAVLDCIDGILDDPQDCRQKAPPLQDANGRALLSTVGMHETDPRWFVFWRLGPYGPIMLGAGPLPEL